MIKTRLNKACLIFLLCFLTWAFPEKTAEIKSPDTNSNGIVKRRIDKKGSDSLEVLSVILQSEFSKKNKVFICKNPGFADSLVHSLCDESTFKNAISDSAILKEIKSGEEFNRYWESVEADNGITDLRNQLRAEDVDKTLIPKVYAFDSSVVIYPGWIIIRKK